MTIRAWRADTGDVKTGESMYNFCSGYMKLVAEIDDAQRALKSVTDFVSNKHFLDIIDKKHTAIENMEARYMIVRRNGE